MTNTKLEYRTIQNAVLRANKPSGKVFLYIYDDNNDEHLFELTAEIWSKLSYEYNDASKVWS